MAVNPNQTADFLVAGSPVSRFEAIDAAAKMLQAAAAPLIVGLDDLDLQAQLAAWKLSDLLRGTIDRSLKSPNRGSTIAMQRCGKVTASFGEIRNRADCLVCWFSDPAHNHPQQWDKLLDRNPPQRKLIVIDHGATKTAIQADLSFNIPREQSVVALSALRSILAGIDLDPQRFAQHQIDLEAIKSLASAMVESKYGALLYKESMWPGDRDLESESLARLVKSLNDQTRFVMSTVAVDDNHLGAEYVLTATTGFPFAVNLNRGAPRYHGLEYCGIRLLTREAVDAVLAVDRGWLDRIAQQSDSTRSLWEETDFLKQVPFVQLMVSASAQPLPQADIAIRVQCPGDTLRADGAMLRGKPDGETAVPADELLLELAEQILAEQ